MQKILIIEDDVVLRSELKMLLENAGYEAETVTDFADALNGMAASDADLILMDINLPGQNGEMLLKEFRRSRHEPVIMLTSRVGDLDEMLSMSYGADDYITKPFNPAILLLRIAAVLKRSGSSREVLRYRGIEINVAKGSLMLDGQEQVLTKNEMIVFSALVEHQGEIVARDALMTALWDSEEFVNDNALTVCISRLRSKLAVLGLSDVLETRKKQGYVLK